MRERTAMEALSVLHTELLHQNSIDRLTSLIEFGKRRLKVIELQQEHLASLHAHTELDREVIQLQQQALQRQKVNTVRLRTKLETKRAVLVTKQMAGES